MTLRQGYLCLLWALIFMISGCIEEGVNIGNNAILLNASVLKGKVQNGVVKVFDSDGYWLWEGESDDKGWVSIPISSAFKGEIAIEVTPSINTRMRCDASVCLDINTGQVYPFNDYLYGSSVDELILSSFFLIDDLNTEQAAKIQINGLTFLAKQWLDFSVAERIKADGKGYSFYAQYGTQVITRALGLQLASDLNVFSMFQIDLNEKQNLQGVSENIVLLSLINASFSHELSLANMFLLALVTFAADPTDIEAQNQLEAIQKKILKEVERIAALSIFTGISTNVLNQIQQAANTALDFAKIANALIIDNPIMANAGIKTVTASSSHWAPTSGNARERSWWWRSDKESGNNEWLQLDFEIPINPRYLRLSLDQRFQGYNLKLQGRGRQDFIWTDLSDDLSSYIDNAGVIDEKNTVSIVYALAVEKEYGSFRLLSPPTTLFWLEAFCFYHEEPSLSGDCVTDEYIHPDRIAVSSLYFSPEHVISNDNLSVWVSSIASGQAEWLNIHYFSAFNAQSVSLSANASYLGHAPKIQGLDAASEWQTLIELDVNTLKTRADASGFITVTLPLNHHQAYQQYRYYSEPTTFIVINALNFYP
ncbi:hypothetical protein [Shewanella surugensis]|uniref:Discoidin domain-containing protein n=1 Tax=Shewanella surugensis TaxID=212020 RepID=A0ABT0L698_9GAMM|nr:hypothetical protein [Shewanella surugensis]MCL1123214.1 hypothetical protein [Shewanella surugensis]